MSSALGSFIDIAEASARSAMSLTLERDVEICDQKCSGVSKMIGPFGSGAACSKRPGMIVLPSLLSVAVVEVARAVDLAVHLQLQEAHDLDLANAFAGEVEDLADLLERGAATVGDVERAGFLQLPDLEV